LPKNRSELTDPAAYGIYAAYEFILEKSLLISVYFHAVVLNKRGIKNSSL